MTKKKVVLMEFESNPNIGLYMFANDKFAIIGQEVKSDKLKEIEKVLNVPVYRATVLGTELIGVFVSGNDEYLLLPQMYDYEMKIFEKICKEHSVKLVSLTDIQNTYGNNICFGKEEVLINANYSTKFKKDLEKETKLKPIQIKIVDYENVGALAIYKNGKYFLSNEIGEKDAKEFVKKVAGIGTINSGSNYIASGVVANSNGIIIGSMSTSVEIQNIVESLEYI